MRPSLLDINTSYQAALKSIEDHLFSDEEKEQPEIVAANSQQTPFTGLSPGHIAQSNRPNTTSEVGTSTASQVTIITIQRYLLERGYEANSFLLDAAIQRRLNAGNFSAETLLVAMQTVNNPHHPLMARLSVRDQELAELSVILAGITTMYAGFPPMIRTAIRNANNNPDQLIINLLQNLRNH